MISLFRRNGDVRLEWYPKAASEAFEFNDIVGLNTNGYLTKYADGSSYPELGLIQKEVTSSDSDYADNNRVPVLVPNSNTEFLCDVSTGTAAQTDVGEYIDVDDENSVDVTATSNNDFYVTAVLTDTNQVIAKMSRLFGRVVE